MGERGLFSKLLDDLTNKELADLKKEAEFPTGWLEVDFGELFLFPGDDIVDGPFGSNLKASEYISDGVPVVRLQNIDRHRFVLKNIQYVSEAKAKDLARHTFIPGDILITKLGDPLGKACIAPTSIEKGVLVADVVRARLLHKWINHKFLCYQINTENVVQQFKSQTKGTTRPRVNLTKIRALRVRICPVSEQSRIVEKLEELLSDLDAGVTELKAAQKKLTQYRQSLLKAAVEGRLTAEWRARRPLSPNPSPTRGEGNQVLGEGEVESENSTPLPPGGGGAGGEGDKIGEETGAQLLERILAERRRRWEEKQLAKFKEQGKTLPKDWRDKYPEPVKPNTANLPELPERWVWATTDCLITDIEAGKSFSCEERPPTKNEVGVVKVSAVSWGEFGEHESKTCIDSQRIKKSYFINSGDFLFSRANTIELVGACVIVHSVNLKLMLSDKILRLVFVNDFLKKWLLIVFRSKTGRVQIENFSTGNQESMRNIGQERIRQILVPLPPINEIYFIYSEFSNHIQAITNQENSIDLALKQSSSQRQNILKAAFSGQLVPQDPNDEPASVLLERIRAERAARESAGRRRGRKAKEDVA